ncbi:hypothetical protein TWF569_002015 [Orbilia oligospora]|nr:hypothetical protein TWF569_002015 [Orbilia oligospora]
MTTVEEALALTLPKILHRYGTRHSASLQKDFMDRRLIYYWKGFEVDVMQSLEKSDLTGELNFINPPEREVILVGNEHGLTGRFQENVGTLLGRAFDTSADSKINRLRFGDSQVVPSGGGEADTQPDIKSAKPSEIPETDDPAADDMRRASLGLCCLEPTLGIVPFNTFNYVDLKYGFLSTYEHTIFVKRAGRARFEITDPIEFKNTNPTIRQCFFHMGKYDSEEDEEEDPSSSSRNIRRKKRDAPEDEADDVDEGS